MWFFDHRLAIELDWRKTIVLMGKTPRREESRMLVKKSTKQKTKKTPWPS